MAPNPRSFVFALRAAVRSFRRTPGVLTIAVSSLAIALGLATAVIAQIDALMNPRTPIRDADRLYHAEYRLADASPALGYPTLTEMVTRLRTMAAIDTIVIVGSRIDQLATASQVTTARASVVAPGVLEFLGLRPRLGRTFASGESPESRVAIVTDRLWHTYFQNRPAIDGATLMFGGDVYSVVGVLPRGINNDVPMNGRYSLQETAIGDVVIPARRDAEPGAEILFRVRSGVERARVEEIFVDASGPLAVKHPRLPRRISPFSITRLAPNPLALRQFHVAMVGAAVFVLLIACANVAALMLARGVDRRRNHALRLALGAKRSDLLRHVAAEVVVLTALGGLAGIVVAVWAVGVLTAATPEELTRIGLLEPQWSLRVFGAMLAAVVVATSLAAFVPSWYVARIAPAEPLKESSATTTGRSNSVFHLLVVAELALAMVLLLGASLITKSAGAVAGFDFGYEARSLASATADVSVRLTQAAVDSSQRGRRPRGFVVEALGSRRESEVIYMSRPAITQAHLEHITSRLRALPGVRDAGWITGGHLDGPSVLSDETYSAGEALYQPQAYNVSAGFFATLGLPVVAGRDFTEADRTQWGVAILDERAAKALFPSGNAVGHLVKLGAWAGPEPWIRVVGVVRNAVHRLPAFPEMEPDPIVYVTRAPAHSMIDVQFVVRPNPDVTDIQPLVGATLRSLVPPNSIVATSKWIADYDRMLASRRFVAGMFTTLGLASLVLATAGLFGVLSYTVSRRMREFAVRVALGAQRRNMLRLVFHDGLVMVLGGTAIGAGMGMYAAFVVYEWLWGVYPVDATALIVAEAVLFVVTMAASALPALRATRANPLDIIRAT